MDTESSSVVDVPEIKLVKVGKDREKKRGGAGWLSGGGAGAGFDGAIGGAGGFMGTGMSLAKVLMILLVSGGISAGAWQVGNMLANSSAGGKAAPKIFADDASRKYADTSGVIKPDSSIPNSLGYVNDDGLTDEQRAAKKAAEEAAARKAAEDAQKKADEDAKKKALEDAKAAAAAAAAPAAAAVPKKGLAPGKFGFMSSSLGGGSGLSGGAGLSGGINRSFATAPNLGAKGQSGALSGFRAASKVSSTRTAPPPRATSNSKGFAKQQLDTANGQSRAAVASGQTESAATGASAPFDNNPNQGTVISGPGLANGSEIAGPADAGSSTNGSPVGGGGTTACPNANYAPDVNGNCVDQTATPSAVNAAPYQSLINIAMILLAIVAILSVIAMFLSKGALAAYGKIIGGIVAVLGVAIAGIGATIAAMPGGDFMIGGIVGVVGAFVTVSGGMSLFGGMQSMSLLVTPAATLVASAVGELAAASTMASSMM